MSNSTDIIAEQALKELEEAKEALDAIVSDETQWTEKDWEQFRKAK